VLQAVVKGGNGPTARLKEEFIFDKSGPERGSRHNAGSGVLELR
jgi:hypothetical protein